MAMVTIARGRLINANRISAIHIRNGGLAVYTDGGTESFAIDAPEDILWFLEDLQKLNFITTDGAGLLYGQTKQAA